VYAVVLIILPDRERYGERAVTIRNGPIPPRNL